MAKQFYDPPDVFSPTRIYSHGVLAGRVLTLAGQAPLDDEGRPVSDDPQAQCRKVFEDLGKTLALAGASFADAVYLRVYLTRRDVWPVVRRVAREVLGETRPACTAIVVPGLRREGALVEVEVIAVLE